MKYLRSNLAFAVIIVLVIIVLALAGYLAFDFWQKKNISNQSNSKQKQLTVIKNDLAFNKYPEEFPTNVPIEEGAEITQNYNATTPDGRFQATRTFVTKQSLADNFKTYQNYLKNNGWEIEASIDQDTYKMIIGSKDKAQLQISINENTISKVKTVDISMTKQTTDHLTSGFEQK